MAAVIALGAAVALFRFKANVIHVIAACAGLGLVVRFWPSQRVDRNRPQAAGCSAIRRIDWRASAGNTSSA